MLYLKSILKRLKNPSVLISIGSQIVTILLLFNIQVDVDLITGVIAAACSIFVLLGILSDPNTQNKGYPDDVFQCSHCNKPTEHVVVNGQMVCRECGCNHCIEK